MPMPMDAGMKNVAFIATDMRCCDQRDDPDPARKTAAQAIT